MIKRVKNAAMAAPMADENYAAAMAGDDAMLSTDELYRELTAPDAPEGVELVGDAITDAPALVDADAIALATDQGYIAGLASIHAGENPYTSEDGNLHDAWNTGHARVDQPPAAEAAYAVTLVFPPEEREFSFHGCKVDVSSITPAGLKYLLGLGFTTSLTQCNAGRATAMKEEGRPQTEIEPVLAANREARLQKICDGSIAAKGGGGVAAGGPRKALDERLLADMAWAGVQAIYKRNRAKLPKPGAEKSKAIATYLAIPHNRKRCEQMVAAMMGVGEDA